MIDIFGVPETPVYRLHFGLSPMVRLPLPISIGRLCWIELPRDYTQADVKKIIKIVQFWAQCEEDDEKDRQALIDRALARAAARREGTSEATGAAAMER